MKKLKSVLALLLAAVLALSGCGGGDSAASGAASVVSALASGFFGTTHPVGEYNGYTYYHLPGRRFGSRVVAMPAMRAACMARSSLESRCCAKYGRRACSRTC